MSPWYVKTIKYTFIKNYLSIGFKNLLAISLASSWANYGTARKTTLKLFPPPRILKELEKDYHLMEAMFFREVPDWEVILKTIENFEKEFNDLEGVSKGEVEIYD